MHAPVVTPVTSPEASTVQVEVVALLQVPPVTLSATVTVASLQTDAGPVIGPSESTTTVSVMIQPVWVMV